MLTRTLRIKLICLYAHVFKKNIKKEVHAFQKYFMAHQLFCQ